ncbi:MAG: hypothetical protein II987_02135 [Clostridia bacterium]|nr:hypothetical protein [Clostridia bacterium]
MKKALSLMLTMCMVLSLFATFVISASADDVLTWEDGQINDPADENPDDGQNLKFDNAYGYTFAIEADKKIGGEDNALIETVDEYNACNPNWAISVLLKPAGDLYEVVTVVATPGSAAAGIEKGIAIENGNIVLVAHSSYSHAAGANFEGKLCALALKAGDKVKVADDKSSVYVLIPGVDDKEEDNGPAITETAILSTGKSYTTTAPNRNDNFDDNGVKLTNGVKGLEDAGTVETAGWNNLDKTTANVVEIVVDLGESVLSNSYVIYVAGGNWGIGQPTEGTSVEVFASDSADSGFTSVAAAGKEDLVLKSGDGVATDKWSTYTLTANAASPVQARYIKFVITADPVGNGFIWMDEVEVVAVKTAGGSEPVMETITVDGDLSDNGWAADKWTSVNADNGYWQSVPESETISYKYQLRADDTKLYAAFEIDCAAVEGGNGVGTNVRFWINTDSEATVYTHFYDVYLKDGAVAVNAKYNKAKDANDGGNIENSTINAVMTTKDGKTYVEFSVDLAEFNGAEGFNYFACVSNKVNENVCLYYPVVAEGESRTSNLPYAKWYAEGQATVDVEAIKLGVVSGDTDDNLGDAGIYAIASLALVALIGTAVVIKKRA